MHWQEHCSHYCVLPFRVHLVSDWLTSSCIRWSQIGTPHPELTVRSQAHCLEKAFVLSPSLTLLSQSGESQLLELLIIFALRLAGVGMSPANLIY